MALLELIDRIPGDPEINTVAMALFVIVVASRIIAKYCLSD